MDGFDPNKGENYYLIQNALLFCPKVSMDYYVCGPCAFILHGIDLEVVFFISLFSSSQSYDLLAAVLLKKL